MNAVMSKGSLAIPLLSKPPQRLARPSFASSLKGTTEEVEDHPHAERVVADASGQYHIPVGHDVRTGSSKLRKFVFPSRASSSTSSSSSVFEFK